MTDKEQIEEMVNILLAAVPIIDIPFNQFLRVAEALYNAGYRKVGENDLLITEEELKHKCYIMKGTCKGELNVLDIVRKQTAKEILQSLYNNKERPQFIEVYIRTLAEKFGVKVEE